MLANIWEDVGVDVSLSLQIDTSSFTSEIIQPMLPGAIVRTPSHLHLISTCEVGTWAGRMGCE